jgi:hypothetical protein
MSHKHNWHPAFYKEGQMVQVTPEALQWYDPYALWICDCGKKKETVYPAPKA